MNFYKQLLAQVLFFIFILALSNPISANDQRLKPLLNGSLELHQNSFSDEQVAIFNRRFTSLESIFGNTQTFLTVVDRTESIADVASSAACELLPDACSTDEILNLISELESFSDENSGYRSIEILADNSIKQVIFLDESDAYQNERSILAFRAFFKQFLSRQVRSAKPIPKWWSDGQEEYLTKALLASMSLGERFGEFHKRITSDIAGLVGDQAPLDVSEANYLDISVSGIMKLVHDYGMKAVFIGFYDQYASSSNWDDAFEELFGIGPSQFSASLELATKEGLDLVLLREPNDLVDSLEEPWRLDELSARRLFNLAPFQLMATLPYTVIEGCSAWHQLLMEGHEFGDFNGDGYQDLIFTLNENMTTRTLDCSFPMRVIAVYGAEGSKTPEVVVVDSNQLGARDTVVADINNDGADDLLVVGAGHKDFGGPSISGINLYLGSDAGLVKTTIENQSELNLGDMTAHFATYGDIDGDQVPEFFLLGISTVQGHSWSRPLLIDCDETCIARHPAGFDAATYPKYASISVYNGALVDLDQDNDLDILMNIEVEPQAVIDEPFVSRRYANAAYFQAGGEFDTASPPVEVDMGFRLDENTIVPISEPGNPNTVNINATHYWETELVDLLGDDEPEFVALENNSFHITNSRFLISIYSRDSVTEKLTLSQYQPEDTGAVHDQNFQFRDLDGDSRLDIVSTLEPGSSYDGIALHRNLNPGWSLSTKKFSSFMSENSCNRIYTPDLDADGNLDVIVTCPGADALEIYYGKNMLLGDRDNDSIPDINDTYPLISIGSLIDTDSDGAPNDCDQACINIGMSADNDDDNDGFADATDNCPLKVNVDQLDTDTDGSGNVCDTDDDGDGALDINDPYPLNAPPTLTFIYGDNTNKPIAGITLTLTESDNTVTTLASDTNGQVKLPLDPTATNTYTLAASLTDTGTDPISVQDALYILQHIVELRTLNAIQIKAADINSDDNLTIQDALKVLQHNVELITIENPLSFLDTNTNNPLAETTFSPTDNPSITVYRLGDVNLSFTPNTELGENYRSNPDLSGQFLDAVLINRNPDCRAYNTDANAGNYGSAQISDLSNGTSDGVSRVQIDIVIANNWNADAYNYDNVTVTSDPSEATHCRIISNMIPNHTFGVAITGPGGGGWVRAIDHSDTETTYIPVSPGRSNVASDTPRNPPIYDFDGILLNGVGIAMDSGFCYNPGVTTGPLSLRSNEAGNTSGCGPQNTWFELPAYSIWHHGAENMAAVFDDYFAHGYVGTYHYHAMTHPLQEDNDQTQPPSNGDGSPVIGFAPDGFPIYGHWFIDQNNLLVKAESGYETYTTDSRTPIPSALHGTPPTPWDIVNRPGDFDSDFGLEIGRYEQDWYFAGTGNLDECNGAVDVNGDYGYYVTDKYPFTPLCTFGDRDPSFGKRSPTLPE